jgi:hypothetical protein
MSLCWAPGSPLQLREMTLEPEAAPRRWSQVPGSRVSDVGLSVVLVAATNLHVRIVGVSVNRNPRALVVVALLGLAVGWPAPATLAGEPHSDGSRVEPSSPSAYDDFKVVTPRRRSRTVASLLRLPLFCRRSGVPRRDKACRLGSAVSRSSRSSGTWQWSSTRALMVTRDGFLTLMCTGIAPSSSRFPLGIQSALRSR